MIPIAHDRIQSPPDKMMGKAVIRGTRITVELVLGKIADGCTVEDICKSYPHLAPDDIETALRFAADAVAHPTISAADLSFALPAGTDGVDQACGDSDRARSPPAGFHEA